MGGLSNNQQAIVVFLSAILIGLGAAAATIPDFIPEKYRGSIATIFFVCGAVGFALKEAVGSPAPAPQTVTETPAPAEQVTMPEIVTFGAWTKGEDLTGKTLYIRPRYVNGIQKKGLDGWEYSYTEPASKT